MMRRLYVKLSEEAFAAVAEAAMDSDGDTRAEAGRVIERWAKRRNHRPRRTQAAYLVRRKDGQVEIRRPLGKGRPGGVTVWGVPMADDEPGDP